MRKKHEDAPGDDRPTLSVEKQTSREREPREIDPKQLRDDAALRPRSFDEYVGQRKVLDNLKVFVQAAQRRGERLETRCPQGAQDFIRRHKAAKRCWRR